MKMKTASFSSIGETVTETVLLHIMSNIWVLLEYLCGQWMLHVINSTDGFGYKSL